MKKTFLFGLLIAGAMLTTSQVNAQNGTRNDAKSTKEVKATTKTEDPKSCHQAANGNSGKACCQSKAGNTTEHASAAKEAPKACCQKGQQQQCDKAKENK